MAAWTETPDLATANQGEDGILELCELLWTAGSESRPDCYLDDARRFAAADVAARCVRAWSNRSTPTRVAVAHAEAIERTLAEAGVTLEQVHHGDGIVSWQSIGAQTRAGMASGPVWRTRPFCPTGA